MVGLANRLDHPNRSCTISNKHRSNAVHCNMYDIFVMQFRFLFAENLRLLHISFPFAVYLYVSSIRPLRSLGECLVCDFHAFGFRAWWFVNIWTFQLNFSFDFSINFSIPCNLIFYHVWPTKSRTSKWFSIYLISMSKISSFFLCSTRPEDKTWRSNQTFTRNSIPFHSI